MSSPDNEIEEKEEKSKAKTVVQTRTNPIAQLATAIQQLNHRMNALELDVKKALANTEILEKYIELNNKRIAFIEQKIND